MVTLLSLKPVIPVIFQREAHIGGGMTVMKS
jgi:hypothetical protein